MKLEQQPSRALIALGEASESSLLRGIGELNPMKSLVFYCTPPSNYETHYYNLPILQMGRENQEGCHSPQVTKRGRVAEQILEPKPKPSVVPLCLDASPGRRYTKWGIISTSIEKKKKLGTGQINYAYNQ